MRLDDDTYQDILRLQCGGKESARDLTKAQTGKLMKHFEGLGWSPGWGGKKKQNGKPGMSQEDFILLLWRRLGDAGKLHDSSDIGLSRFVLKLTKKSCVSWCGTTEKNRVIEALKSWDGTPEYTWFGDIGTPRYKQQGRVLTVDVEDCPVCLTVVYVFKAQQYKYTPPHTSLVDQDDKFPAALRFFLEQING